MTFIHHTIAVTKGAIALAKAYDVQGAIIMQQKFCDPHELDIPSMTKALNGAGIKTLFLEFDVTVPIGQFKVRVEAFLEMLSEEEIQDILDYTPFIHDIDHCLSAARENRLEIVVADLEVEIAGKEVKLARKDYYPSIDLKGRYTRVGDEFDVDGGEGISDSVSWDIRATAQWNFWEWGRTTFGIREKLHRLSQAQYRREEILDNIDLEVKTAYLRTKEGEKNIITVEKN